MAVAHFPSGSVLTWSTFFDAANAGDVITSSDAMAPQVAPIPLLTMPPPSIVGVGATLRLMSGGRLDERRTGGRVRRARLEPRLAEQAVQISLRPLATAVALREHLHV